MSSTSVAEMNERAPAAPHSSRWRSFEETRGFMWLLLVPILIFFIALNVIPTIWMIGLSFYDYSLMSPAPPSFSSVENYQRILNDAEMWGAFGRTFAFVVLGVSIQTVLGLVLGFLFWGSTQMPGRRFALTLLFVPMVLTPVASGLFWRLILEPTFGVINHFVVLLGGQKIDFLTNVRWAFPAVLFVDVWMWTPFMILMTLAALGSVPRAELEAADVDRLSWWQRLWYVIIPHGKFILMLGILLRTIDAYKTTDLPFLMTNGGPGNITEFIGLKLYRYAFASLNIGFSSALAVILLLIAIAFTSIYLYVLNLRARREAA